MTAGNRLRHNLFHTVAVRRARLLLSLALLLAATAWLGVPPGRAAKPDARRAISPGDVLLVDVVGREDLSGRFPIGPDGSLFLPLVGNITAAGRTVQQLAAELGRRYSLFDRDVSQVNVAIAEYKSSTVYVWGAVARPGKHTFAEEPTVWQAIGEAGGPAENAQLSSVEIVPGDVTGERQTQYVDIANAIRTGQLASLPRLKTGDTVRVPSGLASSLVPNSVLVFGAVITQGMLPLDQAEDLVTAIVRSGGPTPDANLKKIEIVRKSGPEPVRFRINLNDYLSNVGTPGNPPLEAGDAIYIPRHRGPGFFTSMRGVAALFGILTGVVGIIAAR